MVAAACVALCWMAAPRIEPHRIASHHQVEIRKDYSREIFTGAVFSTASSSSYATMVRMSPTSGRSQIVTYDSVQVQAASYDSVVDGRATKFVKFRHGSVSPDTTFISMGLTYHYQ